MSGTVRILPSRITANTRRKSLQVPHYSISLDPETGRPIASEATETDDPEAIDAPTAWFEFLKDGRPCLGRESGYLYLTRAGYEANADLLRAAYEGAGGVWEEFQTAAEKHFAKRRVGLDREIAKAERRLAQALALRAQS